MKALDLKKNDTVATSPISFVSTANSVLNEKRKLNFLDVNKNTGQIDIDILKKLKTEKIKVLIPVHLSGAACDLEKNSSNMF